MVHFKFDLFSTIACLFTLSCAGTGDRLHSQWVTSVTTQIAGLKPSVTSETRFSTTVDAAFTVDKTLLLKEKFFYGADLQYSSQFSKEMNLYNQSLAIGHIPAFFRIVGDELELIGDMTYRYPSDVNHPEQLLSRFKIIAQTEKTLTLAPARSGATLVQMFTGEGGHAPVDTWVRSLEFAEAGGYFLQETSALLADGTILEFLETIFPRSNLEVNEEFKSTQIVLDPEDPVGAESGPGARYRFLKGEPVFQGEKQVVFAQRYDLTKKSDGSERMIEWYVTENIPEDLLVPVGAAVEGWNRYFRNFKGFQRDVIKFKGRLPQGIHLGDPRFNVINWDSRLVAGAAYESQASDPFTGKQSHSLIYLPAAWIQIGKDYWKRGEYSDWLNQPRDSSHSKVLPGGLTGFWSAGLQSSSTRVSCQRDLVEAARLLTSGRIEEASLNQFAIELLKQVLFHEVGHALGLAHNFKGSLSYDREDPKSLFSTSIMDYNDYEIERQTFKNLASWEGPELEYDRRALSALYDKEEDVSEILEILPACNDEEADEEKSGVDPLCIRYDLEKDPTQSVGTAWDRIRLTEKPGDITLTQAVNRVSKMFFMEERLKEAKTREDFSKLAQAYVERVRGAVGFYLFYSPASLARSFRSNLRSLLVFQRDVLPEGYQEAELRQRVLDGLERIIGVSAITKLPQGVRDALLRSKSEALDLIQNSAFLTSVTEDVRKDLVMKLDVAMTKNFEELSGLSKDGISRVRVSALAQIKRHPEVPYFFGRLSPQAPSIDVEARLVQILLSVVIGEEPGVVAERVQAATTLLTYSGRLFGDNAIKTAISKLQMERMLASDNNSREAAELIFNALSGK